MRSIGRSSFAELIRYLTDPQGKNERVGKVSINNCANDHPKDLSWALHEIEATQAQNQRATGDKTYHMLISFPSGDKINETMLAAIEARVCKSLGLANHQRISVIHYDTDNTHVHVAINKIHPKKFTLHEPYLAYKTMAKVAVEIETEYGLEKTNHEPRKIGPHSKALDMERHTGIESLISWIQRECLEGLQNSQSWHQLHQVLQTHYLSLRQRGNGFIIMDAHGLAVKASSISRTLSKNKLEAKLGSFEPPKEQLITQKIPKQGIGKVGQKPPKHRQYQFILLNDIEGIYLEEGVSYIQRPFHTSLEHEFLYIRYKEEQCKAEQDFKYDLLKMSAQRNQSIAKAVKNAKFKRAAVKLFKSSSANKRLVYALIQRQLKAELTKANQEYRDARKSISPPEHLAWLDWLVKEANNKNHDALDTLRRHQPEKTTTGNCFSGDIQNKAPFLNEPWDSITRQGTVIYHRHDTSIREDAQAIHLPHGWTPEGLKEAMHMAVARFGEKISVQGDTDFIAQVLEASLDIKLTFADEKLQQERQKRIQAKLLETKNAQRISRRNARRLTQ